MVGERTWLNIRQDVSICQDSADFWSISPTPGRGSEGRGEGSIGCRPGTLHGPRIDDLGGVHPSLFTFERRGPKVRSLFRLPSTNRGRMLRLPSPGRYSVNHPSSDCSPWPRQGTPPTHSSGRTGEEGSIVSRLKSPDQARVRIQAAAGSPAFGREVGKSVRSLP